MKFTISWLKEHLETNASEVGFFSYRDPLGKSRKIDAFLLAAFEK